MNVNQATRAPQPNEEAERFSPEDFLQQTTSITRKKEYPALKQALMDYHEASTLEQYPEKLDTLKQQLATVLDRYPNKPLNSLRRWLNHINTLQITIERYTAEPATPLPARLHFSHIGRLLTQREQQHLALWQTVQEASGESLILWYDSDALWVERLNQCQREAALQRSFQQQPNSSTPLFLKQLDQNLTQLQESSHQAIQQAIDSCQSADLARQQLLITRYQQPQADLTARLEEHQRVWQQLIADGITLCDLRDNLNSGPLAQPYQRELLQRANLTAATQLASLQRLQQTGGSYLISQALPPLAETFWIAVNQIYRQQQGMSSADPQQVAQTLATLKAQWLQSDVVQAVTWQRLWKHNPQWMPETTAEEPTVTEQQRRECSALLQAVDCYAQSKPAVTSVFQSMAPLALRHDQGYWLENAVSHHNPLLLAAHPNSKLLQAAIQEIQANYQSLAQLEQRVIEQQQPLQDREARIEAATSLALPPSLARALVDYWVEGVTIGADATRVLSGIGALQRGAERYYAAQLLPTKLLKSSAPSSAPGSVNQLINRQDSQPFNGPLGSERTAQAWYQQCKELYAQPFTEESEQQRLDLLAMMADQTLGGPLPTTALNDDSQHVEGLLGWLSSIDQHLTKNDELKLTGLSYHLAKSLLTLIPRAIHQVQDEMAAHTVLTRSEKLESIARALLGMKPAEVVVNKVQQGQLDQLKQLMIAIHRKLLKNTLTHAVDTLVYGEIMLQLDPIQNRQCLVYRPQILNVASGINATTLPRGNLLSYAEAPNKSVLFALGDGDHQVTGVLNKPNQFPLTEGRQWFQGGEMADCFTLSLPAEALQRQIALARREGLPCYRLDGSSAHNKLLIQSEVKSPTVNDSSTPDYCGYTVDLQRGRVWMRQHNPSDPPHPVDQAVLLMTLRNIDQVEISTRLPTHSVIKGPDWPITVILHRHDLLYSRGGKNTLIIHGGASVHSPASGNLYRISQRVHQPGEVEIKISEVRTTEPSTVHLPVEHQQLSAWRLVDNDLIVGLGTQPQSCQLILTDVYQTVNDQRHLLHDHWRFFTQDGLQLLPQWPAVTQLGDAPLMPFTAHYAKAWDQRLGAAAVTSTCSPYQLQPTLPDDLAAATTVSDRLIEDLSALEEEPGSAITMDSTVEVATRSLPVPLTGSVTARLRRG